MQFHFVCFIKFYCALIQEASDPQPAQVDEKAEPFRAALDKSVSSYAKDHYPSGVVTVSSALCNI